MTQLRYFTVMLSVMGFAQFAGAQQIGLQNLDQPEFKDVVSELSSNFMHTSVSGAATLGDIFGIELGLVGGMTKTPGINKIVKDVDPDQKADQIYHGALLGMVTVPLGFTVEAGLVPKIGQEDFKFNSFSLASKWTPTQLFFEFPVDLAVKAHLTKAHVEFQQDINSAGTTKFEYDNTIMGLTLLASKSFVLVEPYVGVGYAKGSGELSATGASANNLFLPSVTTSTSAKEDVSGMSLLAGAELKLFVVKLGLEYSRVFDTNRYSGKLSFYF